MSDIRDIKLAPSGEQKINWVESHMPLLGEIKREISKTKPFKGKKIALSVHMEAKTAYLCRVLEAGGAEMHVSGCNPLSTQDDVAAALAAKGMDVHAWHGATAEEYKNHLRNILKAGPNIIIDDGGDLVNLIYKEMPELIPTLIGGCEETTTGVIRLKSMASEGKLEFPMIAVNDAKCKCMFDNFFGTAQSAWDGINRTTNLIVAGKNVVIAGFGHCGEGIAEHAKGQFAQVYICEIDPVKALQASMKGYKVVTMDEAAKIGDLFITSTGCCDVITERHFKVMKDGAIMCNAGHFNVEVDVDWLEKHAEEKISQRNNIVGYKINGKTLSVLADGRLVNLASGDGHPAEIMDMSFAIQALSAKYLIENQKNLKPGVISVPEEIDIAVAERKLKTLDVKIDTLTPKQEKYLKSWDI